MSAKILVVDDEPDLQHLINQKFRQQIRQKMFEFVFAQNGIQALDQLQKNADINLVLTDINMPEMDGLTLLGKLKEMDNPLLRAIIISAYGDMYNIRTAMNRGAFDFVIKPIDLVDLEITINKSLADLETLKLALRSKEVLLKLQQELDIANTIQTSILPRNLPENNGKKIFDICAKMIPAKQVGGDFYDFFMIDKHRLGFIIGDVSGKGVPAALLMAVTKTLLKATAISGASTDACLAKVNNILVSDSLPNMFVTVFYAILDTRNGALEYCSGGHNPAFVISGDGHLTQLKDTKGLLLGFVPNVEYDSEFVMLRPGDTIFLYTDGVTEAMNEEENQFEEQLLVTTLGQNHTASVAELLDKVIQDVNHFTNGVQQSDDITCVGVRYLAKQ